MRLLRILRNTEAIKILLELLGRYEEKCIFFLKYLEISKIVRTFAK